MQPSGFQKFLVHNVSELEALLTRTQPHRAETAHDVPSETTEPLYEQQPGWPSKSLVPVPGCAAKKRNGQLLFKLHLCS